MAEKFACNRKASFTTTPKGKFSYTKYPRNLSRVAESNGFVNNRSSMVVADRMEPAQEGTNFELATSKLKITDQKPCKLTVTLFSFFFPVNFAFR